MSLQWCSARPNALGCDKSLNRNKLKQSDSVGDISVDVCRVCTENDCGVQNSQKGLDIGVCDDKNIKALPKTWNSHFSEYSGNTINNIPHQIDEQNNNFVEKGQVQKCVHKNLKMNLKSLKNGGVSVNAQTYRGKKIMTEDFIQNNHVCGRKHSELNDAEFERFESCSCKRQRAKVVNGKKIIHQENGVRSEDHGLHLPVFESLISIEQNDCQQIMENLNQDVCIEKCSMYESTCTNGSYTYNYTHWTIPDPRNQKLNWKKPPLTVLVVKKMFDENALSAFLNLVIWLVETKNMLVYCEASILNESILLTDDKFKDIRNKLQFFSEGKDDLTNKVDFIICLGGDGTLLYASSLFQSSVPPVMAFNLGSLGFLTPFHFNNFKEQVSQVLEGYASLLLRYRLKCVVSKTEVCSTSPHKNIIPSKVGARILVFNEVVIDRGQSSYLTNLDLYVEGRLVTTAQGDGIIISTPTGSTAYAMAAGASMVHPSVPAIVITPICPHSLSFRPIVVPAGVEIKVMVAPDSRNSAWASFDGRDRQEITQGDSVIITTAQYPVPSVCFKDQMDDWFDSLAECLHWNVRKPQKPLASTPSVTSLDSIDLSN